MTAPTRFEIDGERHYATDQADKAFKTNFFKEALIYI